MLIYRPSEKQSRLAFSSWDEIILDGVAFRKGCIHHTDRGSQYCSHDYQKVLRKHGLKASMSGKGNCYDNAGVESFFKSLTGRNDLAQKLAGTKRGRSRLFRIHQWLLQPAPQTLSLGLEKPRGIRTKGRLT